MDESNHNREKQVVGDPSEVDFWDHFEDLARSKATLCVEVADMVLEEDTPKGVIETLAVTLMEMPNPKLEDAKEILEEHGK